MSKKNHTRDCPAVGRQIKSIECAENRHGAYACPADCPHSPFSLGNYDQFLELERRLDTTTLERAHTEPIFAPVLRAAEPMRQKSMAGWVSTVVSLLFNTRGSDGLLFGERWQNAGYPGLRQDEKTLFNCKRKCRFALLEVHQVVDAETLRAVDLLDDPSRPLLVKDRSFAALACRFDRVVAVVYPAPNFLRIVGSIVYLPSIAALSPTRILEELARHQGGSLEQSWLLSNIAPLFEAIVATDNERERLALLNSDIVQAERQYQLLASVKKLRRPLAKAGFLHEDLTEDKWQKGWQDSYVLPAPPDAPTLLGQPEQNRIHYIGVLLLKEGLASLQANSQANMRLLQQAFEKACAHNATFQAEYVKDLATAHSSKAPPAPPSIIPPSLLQNTTHYTFQSNKVHFEQDLETDPLGPQKAIAAYYRKQLDHPVPNLGDRSPRQAAANPQLRPALVEWVKSLANAIDKQNYKNGHDIDINWIFPELGLDDLAFPPPPQRPPRRSATARPIDKDDDFAIEQLAEGLDAIEDLIDKRLNDYPAPVEAIDDMNASGCPLLEDLYEANAGAIDDARFPHLAPFIIIAWLVLVPERQTCILPPGLVEKQFRQIKTDLQARATATDASEATLLASLCRHPLLLTCLLSRLKHLDEVLPKNERFRKTEMPAVTTTLVAAINTLIAAQE